MGGGGKGGGSQAAPVKPQYTDPVNGMTFSDPDMYTGMVDAQGNLISPGKSGAQQLNDEIATRTAGEKAKSDQAVTDKATADAKAESDFQTRAVGAKKQATDNYDDYFTGQGVDPTKYSKQIADAVNTSSNNVADLDPNPQGKYAVTGASDLFNQLTSGTQSQNLAGYNKVFDPSYSLTHLTDDLVNPAVDTAVNAQYDPLGQQLTNAQKRGTLNDTGYDAALNFLKTSKTGAQATVGKLAQSVLGSDRGALDQYIGTGRTAAGSAPLNTAFSTDPYVAGANALVSRDTANFGGDVQNAVGNTKFTDLSALLNAGGAAQGATDPTATNAVAGGPGGSLSPSAIAQAALAKEPRGLGTKGPF